MGIPMLVAGVALPLLAAAARDDRARLRYAIEGLSEGAVIAGVLVVIVTVRAAEPVMALIGGSASARRRGAAHPGRRAAVHRAVQIWTVSLIALGSPARPDPHERDRAAGRRRLRRRARPAVRRARRGGRERGRRRAARIADLLALAPAAGPIDDAPASSRGSLAAAAVAALALLIPGLPDLVAAALAGAVFLGVGELIGMVPAEVHGAFSGRWLGRLRRGV